MADSIFPRAIMRERGAAAFRAGKSRDDHAMNWHAPALAEWLTGYDLEQTRSELAHGFDLTFFGSMTNDASVSREHVDLSQGVA